jgi:uncharacterized protein YodC (DUF2158 family)
MSDIKKGDIVVLTSGSMRMAVESITDETVNCVWCNEGTIGRDSFDATLLRKWETRDDDRGGRSSSARTPYKGDREGGGKRYDDKPKGKPGWDGKPREKKYFRKD